MANEIYVSAQLKIDKGSSSRERRRSFNATQTGTHHNHISQTISTTYGALTIDSGVATAGYAYFCNLDSTNYVEIGLQVSAAFQPFIKLKPGEVAICRLSTTALYARANTASVVLEHWIAED
jgi:hypothetical protein